MESIQEFLKDCLKSVDLKTVTKAELKQMYFKKQGITKLSKEEKRLFSTAVESAYIECVKNESSNFELKDDNSEANDCDSISSDDTDDLSRDSGLDINHKESFEVGKEEELIGNSVNNTKTSKSAAETSSSPNFSNSSEKDYITVNDETNTVNSGEEDHNLDSDTLRESDNKSLVPEKDFTSSESENELLGNIKKRLEKKRSSESDEENVISKKQSKQVKKPYKTKPKAILSESEADEELLPAKQTKRKPPLSKGVKSTKNLSKLTDKNTQFLNKKNARSSVDSSDSDDLPLISVKAHYSEIPSKKGAGSKINKRNRQILSDSGSESVTSAKKSKPLSRQKSKMTSEDSDADPLIKLKDEQNSNKSEHIVDSSDSEEPLSSLKSKSQIQKPTPKFGADESIVKSEYNKKSIKKNFKKRNNSHSVNNSSLSSDNSDEDILPTTRKIKCYKSDLDSNISDSDEEPLSSVQKKKSTVSSSIDVFSNVSSIKKKSGSNENNSIAGKITNDVDTCESEEEPLTNLKRNSKAAPKANVSKKRKKFDSSSDESEAPIKKSKSKSDDEKTFKKSAMFSSDSEEETSSSTSKSSLKKSPIKNTEDSSMDENDEKPVVKPKGKGTSKLNKSKGQKKMTPSESKLENMKKYVRAAGIRISNYDRLFENCKSMKSKCDKLTQLLEKEGLKGRPTLEKCKKLKKKIETKKEVAELDTSNIISSGRPKRSACFDTTNRIKDGDGDSDIPLIKYCRIKGIVDSDDSD